MRAVMKRIGAGAGSCPQGKVMLRVAMVSEWCAVGAGWVIGCDVRGEMVMRGCCGGGEWVVAVAALGRRRMKPRYGDVEEAHHRSHRTCKARFGSRCAPSPP